MNINYSSRLLVDRSRHSLLRWPCRLCDRDTMAACSVVRCTGLPFLSLYLKVRYRNSGRFHFAMPDIAENIASLSEVRPVYMRDCGVKPANKILSLAYTGTSP